ncbi:hypothetical protein [Ramlibacter sp.]|uniref:hypothetical protein n=1 Tax=Ramlibacter sp. TaxID=1917967 RepID=UPI002C0DCF72|nr:hypothetical protein [Ramlibacter sp.]HWI83948.1 hypothetical protein [Ramlibacter sp.]
MVPPSAWNFDPTQPAAKPELPAQQAGALTDRLAQLQSERNAIRARIAAERDVGQRQRLYEQLHRVGVQLSPLERRLAAVASAR